MRPSLTRRCPRPIARTTCSPYFYPMLDEYDYTQEDMPLLPDVGGLRQPGHGYGRQPEDGRGRRRRVRYNTKGVKLITADDGSVTGIYAQDTSANKYLKINAKKASSCARATTWPTRT